MLLKISIGRIDRSMNVELNEFSPEIMEKLIHYGVKRKINDSLSQWSFDAFLTLKGNSDKTEADFAEFTYDMAFTVVQKLREGTWREGGGGGKRGDAVFIEMRETIRVSTKTTSANAKKLWKNKADILSTCRDLVEAKFKTAGRKVAKQNLEYGGQSLFDKIETAAAATVEAREMPDIDLNDFA